MPEPPYIRSKNLSPRLRFPHRAAEYVRMSTDDQQYSIANQHDVILAYAIRNNLTIARTYADAGKSGLNAEGREGLSRLFADIKAGAIDFSTILVYDVSRWGRFQDIDEGAYYEHLCKRAGVSVKYCAETFDNDDQGITGTVIKGIKRAMAAEYSRELSVKVFEGKCRLARKGIFLGGTAGYAMRRQVIDASGKKRTVLRHGEQKAVKTDRIVLIPGPPNEIKVVQWIFKRYAIDRKVPDQIAAELNKRSVSRAPFGPWNNMNVREILTNEKYMGNLVFNRQNLRLKSHWLRTRPDEWIRAEGVLPPIISKKLFNAAQHRLRQAHRPDYTTDDLLNRLRDLLKKRGKLSDQLILSEPGFPTPTVFRRRFGSLSMAYELIGHRPSRHSTNVSEGWEARHYRQYVEAFGAGLDEHQAHAKPSPQVSAQSRHRRPGGLE